MRADQRKHHIIYKTTCTVTGRWYIGMHSTDNLNDKYLGSGERLWKSIQKHGKDAHVMQILEHHPDRKTLAAREKEIVTEDMKKDPLCMNIAPGGIGHHPGWYTTSEETKKKLSISGKGKKRSAETVERMKKGQRISQNRPEMKMKKSVGQKLAMNKPGMRERLCKAQKELGQQSHIRLQRSLQKMKPCTVDGVTIYPSKMALIAALGCGKLGSRSPTFQFVKDYTP